MVITGIDAAAILDLAGDIVTALAPVIVLGLGISFGLRFFRSVKK